MVALKQLCVESMNKLMMYKLVKPQGKRLIIQRNKKEKHKKK